MSSRSSIDTCLTWDNNLYNGKGGFHIRIHNGLFKGLYITARYDYVTDEYGTKFFQVTYDIKEDPSKVAMYNLDMVESRLMNILNRGHYVENDKPTCHQGFSNTQTIS